MVALIEGEEGMAEEVLEAREVGPTSWVDGDYEVPISVRYYVPSERMHQEEN